MMRLWKCVHLCWTKVRAIKSCVLTDRLWTQLVTAERGRGVTPPIRVFVKTVHPFLGSINHFCYDTDPTFLLCFNPATRSKGLGGLARVGWRRGITSGFIVSLGGSPSRASTKGGAARQKGANTCRSSRTCICLSIGGQCKPIEDAFVVPEIHKIRCYFSA